MKSDRKVRDEVKEGTKREGEKREKSEIEIVREGGEGERESTKYRYGDLIELHSMDKIMCMLVVCSGFGAMDYSYDIQSYQFPSIFIRYV